MRASIRVDLLESFIPSITKISPSGASLEMEFNSVSILEITSGGLRSTARSMARSFLHKSNNCQSFFMLYERSMKMRIKGMKAED